MIYKELDSKAVHPSYVAEGFNERVYNQNTKLEHDTPTRAVMPFYGGVC